MCVCVPSACCCISLYSCVGSTGENRQSLPLGRKLFKAISSVLSVGVPCVVWISELHPVHNEQECMASLVVTHCMQTYASTDSHPYLDILLQHSFVIYRNHYKWGISHARYTITNFKHHHRVLQLMSNQKNV